MVIRSTVKPHEKSPEEGSEDRQPKTTQPAPSVIVPVESVQGSLRPANQARFRDESKVDGCDVAVLDGGTPDEALPPATGGVRA